MRSTRLDAQDGPLAEALRSAGAADRRRVTQLIVQRALADQDPPLDPPLEASAFWRLIEELDASESEADFRRARAASATYFLRQARYDDALYEALHAHRDIPEAARGALAALT